MSDVTREWKKNFHYLAKPLVKATMVGIFKSTFGSVDYKNPEYTWKSPRVKLIFEMLTEMIESLYGPNYSFDSNKDFLYMMRTFVCLSADNDSLYNEYGIDLFVYIAKKYIDKIGYLGRDYSIDYRIGYTGAKEGDFINKDVYEILVEGTRWIADKN